VQGGSKVELEEPDWQPEKTAQAIKIMSTENCRIFCPP
jgi:hypothetical protein